MLRQLLEIISSFIGTGGIKMALSEIGVADVDMVSNQVNALSHKDARPQTADLNPLDADLLIDLYNKIQEKYHFIIH
jgi:hypothetical protein